MKKTRASSAFTCEICLLAGGLSSRMGRDKARLRLGRRTLLGHVRAVARALALPVRVIRRDLVPRCGPLGGVYTALLTSRAEIILFMACDMPFVSVELLQTLARRAARARAVFSLEAGRAGFPFALRRTTQPVVQRQVQAGAFSLQALAKKLRARTLPAPGGALELFNINTPEDWREARQERRRNGTRKIPRSHKP